MTQQRGTRGEGSVIPVRDRKTGETRWRIKIPARDIFDRPTPPITKLMPRGTSKAAAQREKRRMLQERDARKLQHTAQETVSSLLDRWITALTATGAQNTSVLNARLVRLYLRPTLGHLSLERLERRHVRAMLEQIIRNGKQPTAIQAQSALAAALDVAIDEGLVVENVARLVRISSIVKSLGLVRHRATHKRVPTPEDVALLVAYLEPHPYGLPVAIMAATGMRLAEALGMAYPRLTCDDGRFLVAQNLTYKTGFQLGPTKTGETRIIVLNDELLERLTQWESATLTRRLAQGRGSWLLDQPFFRVRPGFPDLTADLIFTRPNGRPFMPDRVRVTMQQACQTLGIALITPHMFRAFVDTELARAGVDVETRRGWIGHESAAMDRVYVHTDLNRLRAAGQIITDRLQGRI